MAVLIGDGATARCGPAATNSCLTFGTAATALKTPGLAALKRLVEAGVNPALVLTFVTVLTLLIALLGAGALVTGSSTSSASMSSVAAATASSRSSRSCSASTALATFLWASRPVSMTVAPSPPSACC